MRAELLAVIGDDAGRLLPAMLQRVQPECGQRCCVGMAPDPKNAAFLVESDRVSTRPVVCIRRPRSWPRSGHDKYMNLARPLRANARSCQIRRLRRTDLPQIPSASGHIAPPMIEGDDRSQQEDHVPSANQSESAIRDWCLAYLRRTVDDPAIAIGPDIPFPQMGLDSATSAYFIVELEEWLGAELEPDLVFDYPTVAELARHIVGRQGGNEGSGNGIAG